MDDILRITVGSTLKRSTLAETFAETSTNNSKNKIKIRA